ncbi:MAG: hypothetical protein Q8K22_01815 [Rhodoferax sp.]|nr:hypothetical protein [Rhodoferax sp.]
MVPVITVRVMDDGLRAEIINNCCEISRPGVDNWSAESRDLQRSEPILNTSKVHDVAALAFSDEGGQNMFTVAGKGSRNCDFLRRWIQVIDFTALDFAVMQLENYQPTGMLGDFFE